MSQEQRDYEARCRRFDRKWAYITKGYTVPTLNQAPKFNVPGLEKDRYRIASICDAAIRGLRIKPNGLE